MPATGGGQGLTRSAQSLEVNRMLAKAQSLLGRPYQRGGGHSITDWLNANTYDCSGFVSAILGSVGILSAPQTTQTLIDQSDILPGAGIVTIWDRSQSATDQEHMIIDIAGNWFESGGNSAYNPSGGTSSLTPEQAAGELSGGGFKPYHPTGLGGSTSDTATLAQLWVQAGGPPNVANTMAAIALAESSGDVGAVNSQSGAAGLWQILPSAHPQFNVARLTTDPLYNAQAAVAVYKSQGFGAWATYTSGAYKTYLSQGSTATPDYGPKSNRPGGEPAGSGSGGGSGGSSSGQVIPELQSYVSLRDMPRTAPPGTKNPFAWWKASFTGNWNSMGGNGQ